MTAILFKNVCLSPNKLALRHFNQLPVALRYGSKHFEPFSMHHKARFSTEAPAGSIIYTGSLNTTVKATKFLSISSSVAGFALQPILINHMADYHVVVTVVVATVVGFFTYVTPILINLLTRRYIAEMYYQPAENGSPAIFTAKTWNFFLIPKYLSFGVEDVKHPDIPGPFTSFIVKGKPLLIAPPQFTDIAAYKHLMGFDKPLDLKLSSNPISKVN